MKWILLLFLAVNSVYILWALPVQAMEKEFTTKPSMPLEITQAAFQPTTLIVENALGNVDLVESPQHDFRIEGVALGYRPLSVRLIEPEMGKLIVKVEYPRESFKDGKALPGELAPDALHVRITAPRDLLNHVKIESQIGHIKIEEPFSNINVSGRKLILLSETGNISVSRISAGGGFQIRGQSGRIALRSLILGGGKVDSVRGEITLDNVSARRLIVGNSTGPVRSTDGSGEIQITTVSGLIDVRDHTQGRVTATSQTGDVYLDNPGAKARCEERLGYIKP